MIFIHKDTNVRIIVIRIYRDEYRRKEFMPYQVKIN